MPSSAKNTDTAGGLRERKRLATRAAIIEAARDLTTRHGLSGFTVEQLCEQVGISRRTLFNYFPSKEDAVLGQQGADFPDELAEEFVAGGVGSTQTVSARLMDDMVALVVSLVEREPMSREQYLQLVRVIKAEPHLQTKILADMAARERALAALISRREGISPDDPRALVAISLLGGAMRTSTQTFFSPDNSIPLPQLLADYMAAARELFRSPPSSAPSQPKGKP